MRSSASGTAACWGVPLGVRTAGSLQASIAALGLRVSPPQRGTSFRVEGMWVEGMWVEEDCGAR